MKGKEFLGKITEFVTCFAEDEMEEAYFGFKEADPDAIYDRFVEYINDAVVAGIENGIEEWEARKPWSDQDYSDYFADQKNTEKKEMMR